mgnify:CR=1 FL=1
MRLWMAVQTREKQYLSECTWMEFSWLLLTKISTTDCQSSTLLTWSSSMTKIGDISSRPKLLFIVSPFENYDWVYCSILLCIIYDKIVIKISALAKFLKHFHFESWLQPPCRIHRNSHQSLEYIKINIFLALN